MQGHNSASGFISAIEAAAVIVSISSWILVAVYSKRLRTKSVVASGILNVFGALATTLSVFIPFLFVDLFTGGSGEAMLATLPMTLIGAPIGFFIFLFVLRRVAAR
jgi:hypothetical protein